MQNVLKAGIAYFLTVFAVGFALGTLRTLVLAPALGELLAVAIELPIILTASWFLCAWTIRRFSITEALADRISVGAIAFFLLMLAEVLLSTQLAGRDLATHVALYKTAPAQIGLLGQIAFALFPLWQAGRRS